MAVVLLDDRRIVIESPHAAVKLELISIITMTIPCRRSFTARSFIVVISLIVCACAHAERFDFVALDDTSYFMPGDYAVSERLVARVNTLKPAFKPHVGDIISGQARCDDEGEVHATLVSGDTDDPDRLSF